MKIHPAEFFPARSYRSYPRGDDVHLSKEILVDPYLIASERIEIEAFHTGTRHKILQWSITGKTQCIVVVSVSFARSKEWVAKNFELEPGVSWIHVSTTDDIAVATMPAATNTFFLILDKPNPVLFDKLIRYSMPLMPWFQPGLGPGEIREFFEDNVKGKPLSSGGWARWIHSYAFELAFSYILEHLARNSMVLSYAEHMMTLGWARLTPASGAAPKMIDASTIGFQKYRDAVQSAIDADHLPEGMRDKLKDSYAAIRISAAHSPLPPVGLSEFIKTMDIDITRPEPISYSDDSIDVALFGRPRTGAPDRFSKQVEEIKRLQRFAKIGEAFETSMELINATEAVVTAEMTELLNQIKEKLSETPLGSPIEMDIQLGPGQVVIGGETLLFREARITAATDATKIHNDPKKILSTTFGPVSIVAEGAMNHVKVGGPVEMTHRLGGGTEFVMLSGDRKVDLTEYVIAGSISLEYGVDVSPGETIKDWLTRGVES